MRTSFIAIAIATTTGLLALTGCVDQEASLLLRGNIPLIGTLTQGDDGDPDMITCTAQPPGTDVQFLFTRGEINFAKLEASGQNLGGLFRRNFFEFGASIENRLIDNSKLSGSQQRLDTNDVQITEATVTFKFSDNDANNPSFPRPFSVLVDSNKGTAAFGVPLINGGGEVETIKAAVSGFVSSDTAILTVPVHIQVIGKSIDGAIVESNVFEYPISFCLDCGDELAVTSRCVVAE